MEASIKYLQKLFAQKGSENYGEGLSQEAHMAQSALIALEDQCSEETIVAAGLHDIGHLLEGDKFKSMAGYGIHQHDKLASELLSDIGFSDEICQMVELHVECKRYFCAVDPNYHDTLSPASQETLTFQGGPMNKEEVLEFKSYTNSANILKVREIDDMAKDPNGIKTMPTWFWDMAERVLIQSQN